MAQVRANKNTKQLGEVSWFGTEAITKLFWFGARNRTQNCSVRSGDYEELSETNTRIDDRSVITFTGVFSNFLIQASVKL